MEDKIVTTESIVGGETGVCEVDTSQEPYEGMVFESENAARVFYDEYAKQEGFLTRIVSSRKSEHDGTIISRRLACNKEGFNLSSQKTGQVKIRKRESKREGCMAMILVKREKLGKWVVTKFMREHNHPLVISSKKGRPTTVSSFNFVNAVSSVFLAYLVMHAPSLPLYIFVLVVANRNRQWLSLNLEALPNKRYIYSKDWRSY